MDYDFEGDPLVLPQSKQPDEAYLVLNVHSDATCKSDSEPFRVRFKLLRVPDTDGGDEQWMVEAIFVDERDELLLEKRKAEAAKKK